MNIAWSHLIGLRADRTAEAPDGTRMQLLEVVAEHGAIGLLLPAAELASVLAEVRQRSNAWRRARHPLGMALARVAALVGAGVGRAGPALRALAASLGALPAARALAASLVALPGRTCRRGAAPLLAVLASLAVVAGGVTALVAPGGGASGNPGTGAYAGRFDVSSMAGILRTLGPVKPLQPAAAPPAPAPPALAGQPPLRPHEVFGFAPYWTLPQSGRFDVSKVTTLAYFAVDVNPDGSLDQSGPGWNGYESQALADLVTRAHAAGDRVVLTVDCFDQHALDELTSSPTAPATLSAALVDAVRAKNLDGVNLDLEGQGAADRAGLTGLVAAVSRTLHGADPHWQLTIDTYASSAGDPGGFYDVASLAPWVDGFFVMAYQLNLQASASSLSPLTSPMFSLLATVQQYAATVPPSKVLLGLPFYGYEWPTTDPTLSAQATGPPTPVTDSQIVAMGSPVFWDSVTDTAWTSYQVGGQWYEAFFDDPYSLYLAAQLAQRYGLAGVGAWALGMEGGDPSMLAALDGLAPPSRTLATGPLSLPALPAAVPPQVLPVTPVTASPPTSTAGTAAPSSTTTTTAAPHHWYRGEFAGQPVDLVQLTGPVPSTASLQAAGELTSFQTDDPALACLAQQPALPVWLLAAPGSYLVVAGTPSACAQTAFTFQVAPTLQASPPSTSTTTTTSSTTTTTTPTG